MANKRVRTILSTIIIIGLLWPIKGSRVPLVIGILQVGIPHSLMLLMGITQLHSKFGVWAPYLSGMGAMFEAVWEIAIQAAHYGTSIFLVSGAAHITMLESVFEWISLNGISGHVPCLAIDHFDIGYWCK
jgi:hypothetical protein